MGCSYDEENQMWIHTIKGTFAPTPSNIKLVAAHFHCHAPTCLSVALYNNNTGDLICKEQPVYGQDRGGNPGSGHIEPGPFNEAGYIAVPPCVWGSDEYGLEAPPIVSGQRL